MTRTKAELMAAMARFLADQKRGISLALFCELAAIELPTLRGVFQTGELPMSQRTQRRVSKALDDWAAGKIAVMERRPRRDAKAGRSGEVFIAWRKEPKPRMVRGYGLRPTDGGLRLAIGPRNRGDYSQPTLGEQMKRRR